MNIPVATYRLQFTPAFRFTDATRIIPYLADLGISHVYASPILKSRKGSLHGYDMIEPSELDPELGTEEEFRKLITAVHKHGMFWLQDIVPNHMAFDPDNHMLMDVLENGPASRYSTYFDIEWNHPYESIKGKVLAPILGKLYGESIESGEISLQYDESGFSFNCNGARFPLAPESYGTILVKQFKALRDQLGRDHIDIAKLYGILYVLRTLNSESEAKERERQLAFIKKTLWEVYTHNPEFKEYLDTTIRLLNGEAGKPETFDGLDALHRDQFYKLAFWKVATAEINYRRFFTINDLISLRMEDEKVFEDVHKLIFSLIDEGVIAGLRIDHIDGLYNPLEYLQRLRARAPESYLVVEKILDPDEDLPVDWPVQGTTGYDFLNRVNYLFCNRESESHFRKLYRKITGPGLSYKSLVGNKKRQVIGLHMAGDIDYLANLIKRIASRDRYGSDITLHGLRRALVEVLACFPVYRTYINLASYRDPDRAFIEEAITQAKRSHPASYYELEFIERFLLLEFNEALPQEEKNQWIHFVMRLQQFTGPLMAKGLEDSVFYTYNRLISLNEVGGKPDRFGISDVEFHFFNKKHSAQWNLTMNATSTHDTKRGEDSRARINVLSEMPDEWERKQKSWSNLNQQSKRSVNGEDAPDSNDEYFIYQSLIGSLPPEIDDEYRSRVKAYCVKAMREAQVRSSWLQPDEDYESATSSFLDHLLDANSENPFLNDFTQFTRTVSKYGFVNSLSQTLLKITCPGIPDFYQGCELWDFSFVDPDNRRAVDYGVREQILAEVKNLEQQPSKLLAGVDHPRLKLFLIRKALHARAAQHRLFEEGEYVPLKIVGEERSHALAFLRRREDRWALVVVPKFLSSMLTKFDLPLGGVWRDTSIELPDNLSPKATNIFAGKEIQICSPFPLRVAFQHFPVCALISA